MNKLLLATAAIVVAFSALPFAAQAAKPVGRAPPSLYLMQDTATMKSQIVETWRILEKPYEGYRNRSLDKGVSRDALNADKTCANPPEVSKNERIRL